jgi:hypothetical protein
MAEAHREGMPFGFPAQGTVALTAPEVAFVPNDAAESKPLIDRANQILRGVHDMEETDAANALSMAFAQVAGQLAGAKDLVTAHEAALAILQQQADGYRKLGVQ